MKTPQRIVSLISSATEMLYLLGAWATAWSASATSATIRASVAEQAAADPLAGRCRRHEPRDRPAGAPAGRRPVGLYAIDVERLAALAPDLIITQAQCDVCAVRYEDVVAAVGQFAGSWRHRDPGAQSPFAGRRVRRHSRVGRAIGEVAAAAAVLGRLRSARRGGASRDNQAARGRASPRVACLEWIDPPMLAANWTPQLVELAGGHSGLALAGSHSTLRRRGEQIVDYDPQVIVIMPCGFDLRRAIVEAQVLAGVDGWSRAGGGARTARVRGRRQCVFQSLRTAAGRQPGNPGPFVSSASCFRVRRPARQGPYDAWRRAAAHWRAPRVPEIRPAGEKRRSVSKLELDKFLVPADRKIKLKDYSTSSTDPYKSKAEAEEKLQADVLELADLASQALRPKHVRAA